MNESFSPSTATPENASQLKVKPNKFLSRFWSNLIYGCLLALVCGYVGFQLAGLPMPKTSPHAEVLGFGRSFITVKKADGSQEVFDVELARTPEQQAQGLMFRGMLGDKAGMLFIFAQPNKVNFWMKNTLIPLDMIFADENGSIISIMRNRTPEDLTPVGPSADVKYVLEINGGYAEKFNLKVGDIITFGKS